MQPYQIIEQPFIVPTTDGKFIAEYAGLASSGHKGISIAQMIAPPGWAEPHQTPTFAECTLMVSGKKLIEIGEESIELTAGMSIWIAPNTRVRYSNPYNEPATYWSICMPAFSFSEVNREDT